MFDKNGIQILTSQKTKRGCYTGKCAPSAKSTLYPDQRVIGVSLGKYREIWFSVK